MAKSRRTVQSINAEHAAQLAAFQGAQARQLEHMRSAMAAGKSAQAQVVAKVTDTGELGFKLQGIALDGVKSRAERSDGAIGVFTIVNAQNRQLESMVRYLWAARAGQHASVIAALEPMAQGWETVKGSMVAAMGEADYKACKKGAFTQACADAMRSTLWAK